ncbi:hypothetical protein Dda_0604 [Drechslerella dactyloides]|uniref:1-alkyl-2-acetylglycerophosphocholine esterase n=1 Tax=Drechslerella dactyloides TaxID=74499 RepID=A0AAD6NP78_DREDA|nr:hypothetical protein Dda_0604 [Drechslerella dactyloides]
MMSAILSRLNPVPVFPAYKGPYAVGTIDLELPVAPFVEGGLSPPCPSHADIPTVQMRVFYPAKLKEDSAKYDRGDGNANWVPSPRKEYFAAYARFCGAGDWLANVLSLLPRHVYHTKLPVLAGHKLLPEHSRLPEDEKSDNKLPVVIFSHGLGGTRNAYSYLTASLASYGAVVLCIEHRDGSAPVSFIRESKINAVDAPFSATTADADGIPQTPSSSGSSDGEDEKGTADAEACRHKIAARLRHRGHDKSHANRHINYITQAHEITEETARVRNGQLEIRLWELGLAFAVVRSLNSGSSATNGSHISPSPKSGSGAVDLLGMFRDRLEVDSPGSITWMGHSFGGATITQFLKSVWYHPELARTGEMKDPLYVPAEQLLKHFHPSGQIDKESRPPPAVLLDIWCLPLLSDRNRPLWRRPLPGPVLGVLSWQFYKWKDNLRGFRHVMSRTGGTFEPAWFPDLSKSDVDTANEPATEPTHTFHRSASLDVTPQLPTGISPSDESKIEEDDDESVEESPAELALHRTQSMASQKSRPGEVDRKFFYPKNSAHMSQSDFGILFPRSARYFGGVNDSEGVLEMNIRAVTAFMRERGLKVAPHVAESGGEKGIFGEEGLEGWEAVGLDIEEESPKVAPASRL